MHTVASLTSFGSHAYISPERQPLMQKNDKLNSQIPFHFKGIHVFCDKENLMFQGR